ncbi:MAG: DNA polymerase domain-containing protein [Candidatus Heimdallarchaeaceae archaeon]
MIYLYKSEYVIDWKTKKPIIYLFGRDENKKKVHEIIKNFTPYFYVSKSEEEKILKCPFITAYKKGYKNLFGEEVIKVYTRIPSDVRNARTWFKETWEDDILFNLRYIIDNMDGKFKEEGKVWIGGFSDWKKCYIDIETTTQLGFPDPKIAQNEITAITIYDNYDKKYLCFVWRQDLKNEIKKEKDRIIFLFNNEKDMLIKFCEEFNKMSPDIITGWNIEGFDLPYIVNRLKKVGLDAKNLSPIKKVYIRQSNIKERKYIDIVLGGIGIIDLIKVYRQTHKGELRSYSLRAVALDELNIDKGIVNTENEWKKTDINNLIEYNCRDVELTVKIDEKRKLINFVNSICDVAKCNFEDVKFYSRVSDTCCLLYAKRKNIVLPSKRVYARNIQKEKYEGGLVIANPGFYENVISLDFTSLYPNIMKSFNMSLETIREDGDIDCIKMKTTSSMTGIIPAIVDELINLRKEYKKKQMEAVFGSEEYYMWDAIQQAAKNLYCVLGYGVNALSSFRMYDKRIAESITAIGRELLSQTIKTIEQEGHKVVQGDTDSTYIQFDSEKFKTLQEILDEANRLLIILNKNYNNWCIKKGAINPTINIKFEKVYKRFLVGTKKRWAGYLIWREGKLDSGIDVAGFNVRRSDSSNFTKVFQKEVLNKILKGEKKEDVMKYIYNEINKIQNFEYDFETIGIPTKLNKSVNDYKTNLPVCRGSKWSNQNLGTYFKEGDKFLYIWCKGTPDAICFEFNEQLKNLPIKKMIDMNKMIKRNILLPLERIFEATGWEKISQKVIKFEDTLKQQGLWQ